MANDPARFWITGALLAAAAAWPAAVGALKTLLVSPYDRMQQSAWCGAQPLDGLTLLGHCIACWSGSAILILTAAIVSTALAPRAVTARR